jgi:hypothetical protein
MHDEVPTGSFRTNGEDPFMSGAIDETIAHPQSNTDHPFSWAFHYGLFPLTKVHKRRKYTAG